MPPPVVLGPEVLAEAEMQGTVNVLARLSLLHTFPPSAHASEQALPLKESPGVLVRAGGTRWESNSFLIKICCVQSLMETIVGQTQKICHTNMYPVMCLHT